MLFKSSGKIRYSTTQKYWVMLDADPAIGSYYRNLFNSHHFNCKLINKPSWAEHITVVRNEKPLYKAAWSFYNKMVVEFEYDSEIKTNGDFCWLDVYCDFLYQIRVELGLERNPEYPFHLTIGNRN